MEYVNLTPHEVRLNDGRVFPPSGTVARVATGYSEVEPGLFRAKFGEVVALPSPAEGIRYIVSGMVAQAVPDRADVVSPATGHPEAVRENGQIVSVPGFVTAADGPSPAARKPETAKVLYKHNCADSAKYHRGKYRHYAKLVSSVDTNQTNGYAFVGDFLSFESEHLLPVGSLVVERCGDSVTAYRVTGDDEKTEVANCPASRMVNFIRQLAEEVKK